MVETLHCSVYFLFIFNFNNDNSQITDYRLQITDHRCKKAGADNPTARVSGKPLQ